MQDDKADFIVNALEELSHIFCAKTYDEQEDHTRCHSYAFVWEELCDLFEHAGLAEGFWPNWWCSPNDPRIGNTQPPCYRLIVHPDDTRKCLSSKPMPESLTTGYVFSVWIEIFGHYRKFNGPYYIPIDDEVCAIHHSYAEQILRLQKLGFAEVEDQLIFWHSKVLESREPGKHWERILYKCDRLDREIGFA